MTTSDPHKYQAEKSGWRTCKVCGRGANAGIHRAPAPPPAETPRGWARRIAEEIVAEEAEEATR